MYSQLRTNKGGLRSWLFRCRKVGSPRCRCGEGEHTGDHVMLHCELEKEHRKGWKSWEDIDERWNLWLLPHKNEKGEVEWVENLLETFCTRVSLENFRASS